MLGRGAKSAGTHSASSPRHNWEGRGEGGGEREGRRVRGEREGGKEGERREGGKGGGEREGEETFRIIHKGLASTKLIPKVETVKPLSLTHTHTYTHTHTTHTGAFPQCSVFPSLIPS